jgi:hypothetical protein
VRHPEQLSVLGEEVGLGQDVIGICTTSSELKERENSGMLGDRESQQPRSGDGGSSSQGREVRKKIIIDRQRMTVVAAKDVFLAIHHKGQLSAIDHHQLLETKSHIHISG